MTMGGFKALVISTFKEYVREKALLFWAIVWPLFWIFMVAYVFVPPGTGSPITLKVGVVNYDTSNTTLNGTLLIKVMNETKYKDTPLFNVKLYSNESLLEKSLCKGELDAGIIIPDKWGINASFGQGKLVVLIGARSAYSASITQGVLMGFLEEFGKRIAYTKINITMKYINMSTNYMGITYNETWWPNNKSFVEMIRDFMIGLAEPIKVDYREVVPEVYANRPNIIGFYVIGAIGMMYLYMGFSVGASFIASMKERGVLYRLLSTPIKEYELILGGLTANALFQLISTIIIIVVGTLVTGAHILWNPLNPVHWIVPAMFILLLFMSVGMGALLSPLAKTSSGGSQIGTALGLALSFTTGIWFPPEWLPPWLRAFSNVFPVTWGIDVVRGIMVYNIDIAELMPKIVGVVIATIVIFAIAILLWRRIMAKYIEA